ncbi:MAG: hypothetical protein ACI4F7_01750 [Acutalibacteraceae bacterium]
MKERKYPFSLFVIGFITNILFRFFWLFVPGIIFMVIGIFAKWCLYIGIGLLLLDIIISFAEQMQIRHTMLTVSDNEQFSDFQDAVSMDGNVFENIRNFVENNAEEYVCEDNELVDELKNSITKGMSLTEIIDCFEKMCKTPIEDDAVLFETGTFNFTGKELFYFSLVRQFSNGNDEYYQIHVDIQYNPTKQNKKFHKSVWSDSIDENIFDYIRKSPAFICASNDEYVNIEIFMDET